MKIVSKLFAIGSVIASKIASLAVTENKIANDAVVNAKIADLGVGEVDIAAGAITAGKIATSAVEEAALGTDAVTANKIGALAVTAVKIQDANVDSDEIGSLAVSEDKIGAAAVTESKIGTGAVTESKINDGDVTETKIGTSAVSADKIGTGAVAESNILNAAVTSGKLAANSITETKFDTGSVTQSKIAASSVSTDKLGADSIDGTKIADDAIDSEHFVAGSIDGAHLSDDAKSNTLEYKNFAYMGEISSVAAGSSTTKDISGDLFGSTYSEWQNYGSAGDADTEGIIPNSVCNIRNHSDHQPIEDANHNDVYGKLSFSSSLVEGTVNYTNGSDNISFSLANGYNTCSVGSVIELSGKLYKIIADVSFLNRQIDRAFEDASGSVYNQNIKRAATISYYSLVSGTETAFTMTGQTLDIQFPVSSNVNNVPYDAILRGPAKWIDIGSGGIPSHNHDSRYYTEAELGATTATTGAARIGVDNTSIENSDSDYVQSVLQDISYLPKYEKLTIVTQNVIPDLSETPVDAAEVKFYLYGILQRYGASLDYTVSSKTITWNSANAGMDIDPGDEVWVQYKHY